MSVHLTKTELCKILTSAVDKWKNPPTHVSPCFNHETWYAECFHFYFSRIKVDTNNFVSLITEQFRKALDISFHNISKTLEQQPVDGSKIFEIISEERFILRSDRKKYNCQLPGKSPKGLKTEAWEEYNHWLLANQYWQGFLWSLEPDFKITVSEYIQGPLELFLAEETRPLWGMRIKALDAGTFYIGEAGDCIEIRPNFHFHTLLSNPSETSGR